MLLPVFAGLLSGIESHAAIGNATIVVLRGSAKTDAGQVLKEQDKVSPGTTVITGARSFVRLLFADQTQLNVGPDTTMKVEAGKPGEASVVDLVAGQIRAKVTKDPNLQNANGAPKEKMVIKTKTAAMGVRGTEFNVSFNQLNGVTALITYEGLVAMAKFASAGGNPFEALHQGSGVQAVGAGQYSGANPNEAAATIPVKLSPAQFETLKSNSDFAGMGEKQNKKDIMVSPIPPGVDPKGFASGAEKSLKEAVAKTVGADKLANAVEKVAKADGPAAKSVAPPEGFVNKATGEVAPRAGGFVDLTTGIYVQPPAGAPFDANTGVFVTPAAMGTMDPSTGLFVAPKGLELSPKGFVAEAPKAGSGERTTASGTDKILAAVAAEVNKANDISSAGKTVTTDQGLAPGGGAVSAGAELQRIEAQKQERGTSSSSPGAGATGGGPGSPGGPTMGANTTPLPGTGVTIGAGGNVAVAPGTLSPDPNAGAAGTGTAGQGLPGANGPIPGGTPGGNTGFDGENAAVGGSTNTGTGTFNPCNPFCGPPPGSEDNNNSTGQTDVGVHIHLGD